MVFTTRETSWRTDRSRAGEPVAPRKYLEATTFVASLDLLLLEDHRAALAGDLRVPDLPGELVGRVHAGAGERPRDREPAPPRDLLRSPHPATAIPHHLSIHHV